MVAGRKRAERGHVCMEHLRAQMRGFLEKMLPMRASRRPPKLLSWNPGRQHQRPGCARLQTRLNRPRHPLMYVRRAPPFQPFPVGMQPVCIQLGVP